MNSYPMRRCQPTVKLSRNAKKKLRNFMLEDLEKLIEESQHEIANLRIAGRFREAEEKRRSLRFFCELHSELTAKIDDIEEEQS